MTDQTQPHPEQSNSRRFLEAGWLAGCVTGFGVSGYWWMNPYVALSLNLGGLVLATTAWVGSRS